jgi:hydroxyacylglutathione hydrolase
VLHVHRIVTGTWKENCYIVAEGVDAVVVDPGGEFPQIRAHVAAAGLRCHAVVNTHAHYDHLGAVVETGTEYAAPFHLHPDDADLLVRANFYRTLFLGEEAIAIPSIDVELADAQSLRFGELTLEVVHTPGHTPGSVSLCAAGELFTGDTLMANHLGRTDLPGGDREALMASVDALAAGFAETTVIHPGHGPSAVLGEVLGRVGALPELR